MRRTLSLPVSLIVTLLLVAGCGDAEPVRRPGDPGKPGGPGKTEQPVVRGPGDLVLRAMTVGGIAGLGGKGTLPDVSVYGDGLVIARDDRWAAEYHLTRPAYDRLIGEARRAGLGTPRTIDDPSVADALYTVITFAADRTPKTTKVIRMDGRGGAAAAFAARLDPKTWPAADLRGGAKPYLPAKVAVLAVESPAVDTPDEGEPWPFGALDSGVRVAERTCAVLTGKNAAEAHRLADRDRWRYHGRGYSVTFRPLLPDEADCAALARTPPG